MSDRNIETARGVIAKGIQAKHDFPMWYAFEKCWEVLYGRKGYGLPEDGFSETISEISPDRVREFQATIANPAESLLIIAGNMDTGALLDKITARFGGIPGRPVSPRPVEEFAGLKELVETSEQFQTIITLTAPGLPKGHQDLPALTLANYMLGTTMSARLFKILRDKEGLAYAVHSRNVSYFGSGGFMAFIGTSPGKEEQALNGMFREITKAGSEGFTSEELEMARTFFEGWWVRVGENPAWAFARDYAPLLFGHDEKFSAKFRDAVLATDLKTVNETVSRYFVREKLYTFIYRGIQPEDPEERIDA